MAALKRMLSRSTAIGGLAAATVLAGMAVPAQAQVYGYWGYRSYSYPVSPYYDDAPRYRAMNMLSPSEIRESLRDDGYRVIGQMQRSGRTYVVTAQDRRGQRFRLVVDGIEGEIVRTARLTAPSRNEARTNDYRDVPPGTPPSGADMPPAPHVVPSIGPDAGAGVEPQTRPARPPREAARPENEGPRMRPGEAAPPIARPPGRSQAARPDPARPESVRPDAKPATPVAPVPAQPEAAKPEQKPTEPVAAAPRVVYPGGPTTTAPTAAVPPASTTTVPAAPLDAPPAKTVAPTPDVPVAPLD